MAVQQKERSAKTAAKRFGWRMARWTAGFAALLVVFAYYGAQ